MEARNRAVDELSVIRNKRHYFSGPFKIIHNLDTARWTFCRRKEGVGDWKRVFHSIDKDDVNAFVLSTD